VKDPKELSRSEDKLSCEATVVFNTRLPFASDNAVRYLIEFLNEDGMAMVNVQPVVGVLRERLLRDVQSQIEKQALALLDKREAQRQTPTSPTANSSHLLQSWMGALRARVETCWDLPAGSFDDDSALVIQVRVKLNRDGSLAAKPVVVNSSSNPNFRVAAEASVRAIRRCAPFAFLPQSQYKAWQEVEVEFTPREMFRAGN
jgi:hypothetical protein